MKPISLMLLMVAMGSFSVHGDSPPNIVVFLSDDHTITDSSVYGSTELATPNMARLAADGMTFDQAFVASPSCAPSRAALLTGLMPARNQAEANHSRPKAEIKKLPAYLQELGYEVVSFGKVGHYKHTPEYGFDVARHYGYHEDVAVPESLKWLRERNSSKPLCLFVGTNWPHVPWPTSEHYSPDEVSVPSTHVDTKETRLARARYCEAVHTMDRELGEVYDLAREKFGENMLFIHTSDHGAQWPFGKWNLYDDGIRTPLIASWPGHIVPKSRTQALVSWVDLLPTLVDAAGGQPDQELDGRSILPVLQGKTQTHSDAIFTVHSGDGNMNVFPSRSIRTQRWKLIINLRPEFRFTSHVTKVRNEDSYWDSWIEQAKTDSSAADKVRRYHERPRLELFDLQNDPLEQTNLATAQEHAARLAEMKERLVSWMQDQGDTQSVFGMPELLPRDGPKPNIITIFIDDMGWADLSCFGGTVQTINIDRLANAGIRFTNFYVNSPICSPSRTALTTGHYPARHRITSYLDNRKRNHERGMAQWLDVTAPTLPRMLSEVGYTAGHFGKWHMGGQRDVGDAPLITKYGFAASLTNFEGLGPRVLPLKDAYDGKPAVPHALGSDKLGHGPIEWEDRSVVTKRFVDRALQFIDDAVATKTPFFVNVWPDDVHSPFFPPKALRDDERKRSLYHGVMKAMDDQLGELISRIENDETLRDNTLILVASDNGPEPGAGSAGSLRGHKGELWEGGIRSPLIVWGPGLIHPESMGAVNETTILSSVDLVASLVAMANAPTPENYRSDGENLLAALLGFSQENRSRPLFWRRPPDRPGTAARPCPDLAVRDQNWKLVCNLDGSGTQLFNLKRDVGETVNVSSKNKQVTRRLKSAVLEWNATLPVDGIQTIVVRGTEPFRGKPNAIPGKIEAEHWDKGEAGIAYHDVDPQNRGESYREATQVDIEKRSDASNGHGVGWTQEDEWLVYTVKVAQTGVYDLEIPVASDKSGGTFHLEFDGKDVTGPIDIPDTGGWEILKSIRKSGVSLTQGRQTMKLVMDKDGESGGVGDIDFIKFTIADDQ
ncbi:sulfatase-like hydrolase/transferase [Rubripirellula amarantea]|nr:sulfatase-like hydrolase/transferase [Rubripirellula amarantea]